MPRTEECRARLTERLENAPEHAEKVKVADEKTRGLLGKRGACEIADAEETAAKRVSTAAAAASSNEMPVDAGGPCDGVDVLIDDTVLAGAADTSQLVSPRDAKDWASQACPLSLGELRRADRAAGASGA